MSDNDRQIRVVEGTAIPVHGDDIDTDRILPARYLRAITFEGIERALFEDDRKTLDGRSSGHPIDDERFRGASILLVNRNFGCGSSREHAPQAIYRWGIRACVGESFSEIFFGNSLALGLPCLTVDAEAVQRLMAAVESQPKLRLRVNIEQPSVEFGNDKVSAHIVPAAQNALLSGVWDAAGLLLDRFAEVRAVAEALPYTHTFRG